MEHFQERAVDDLKVASGSPTKYHQASFTPHVQINIDLYITPIDLENQINC